MSPRSDVETAIQAARVLVAMGVPVFLARPALDGSGAWQSTGGHGGTGYWLPAAWPRSSPDVRVIDRWRPGMAMCAVMGYGVDVLDVDPRNGGAASREALVAQGIWPTACFEASTPSGGTHEFVTSLGVFSRDNVRPGLDLKAGVDGMGHGFAFIAPTCRVSKVTGMVEPYRWLRPPSGPLPMDDSGGQFADLVRNRTRGEGTGETRHSGDRRAAADLAAFMALPERELPCSAVLTQVDVIAKALANHGRHEAITGPLLRLVGMANAGHQGLRQACSLVEADFVGRVAEDRAGGQAEALREFQRSLLGALARVLAEGQAFPRDMACECFLDAVGGAAANPALFNRGTAGVTERKVLSYLHLAARQTRSRVVRESQRQIAEAAETSRTVVSRALDRLEDLGWLRRMAGVDILAADPIRLLVPQTCTEMPTEELAVSTTPASLEVGTSLHGRVHRLFGPKGLVAGRAETLAALAERRGPSARSCSGPSRGRLIRVVRGSVASDLLADPWQGARQIPRPALGGGRTVREIAETTGKHRTTIERHLTALDQAGLVLQERTADGKTLWWRLRFDPEQIADRDAIPDTAEAKAMKHARERRAFLLSLSEDKDSRIKRVAFDDETALVDSWTGEVLAQLPNELLGDREDGSRDL